MIFIASRGKKGRADEKAEVSGASETVAQTNTSSVCVLWEDSFKVKSTEMKYEIFFKSVKKMK